jgi:hypothetical protein
VVVVLEVVQPYHQTLQLFVLVHYLLALELVHMLVH